MVAEVLPPGMEDGGDAQGGLEVVAAELQQGGRGTGEQQGIEPRLVVLDERVEVVGQGEHDVEVRDGQCCVLRAISDSDSEANRTAVRSQFGHRSEGIRTGVPAEIRTVFRPLERVSEMGRNNSV